MLKNNKMYVIQDKKNKDFKTKETVSVYTVY